MIPSNQELELQAKDPNKKENDFNEIKNSIRTVFFHIQNEFGEKTSISNYKMDLLASTSSKGRLIFNDCF